MYTTHLFGAESKQIQHPRWREIELKTAVQPPMRYKSTAVCIPEQKQLYLFGGLSAKPSNDLWMLDVESREWVLVRTPGPRPAPRLHHTMTYDGECSFYVFAGQEIAEEHAIAPRSEAEGRELRYKAYQRRPLLSDVWKFHTKDGEWRYEQCPGKQPPPRRGHTTILLTDRAGSGQESAPIAFNRRGSNRMVPTIKPAPIRELLLIGGATENRKGHETAVSDLWSLDLDKMAWQHLQTSGSFQGRFDHTATRVGRRIFVVGGITTTSADYIDLELQRHWGSVQGQIMALEIDSLTWTRIEANPFSDIPSLALHGHTAVQDPSESGGSSGILVFGGRATDAWTSDVMRYDTANNTWTVLPVTTPVLPQPRHGHVCVGYTQVFSPPAAAGMTTLTLRSTFKKTKRTERNLLLSTMSLNMPPPRPLLASPSLLLFGGSLLDGSPSYESGHVFSLEWTQPGPDSPLLPGTPHDTQTLVNSVDTAPSDSGGLSGMPSLMDVRPHTAPTTTFSRTMSSTRNSSKISYREVPWEYQEVKSIIRRQQLVALGGSRAAAQAAKSASSLSLADMSLRRKPVTAPAKLGSTAAGSLYHHHSSAGLASEAPGRRRSLPPSQEQAILQAGKRFGLLHDGTGGSRRHHHGSRRLPHQAVDEDERLTIHERKRLYFQKLRRAQQAAERQHLHQQLSASAFLTDQRPSTSFTTLPLTDMAASLASAAAATRPATTGGGLSRNLRYHPHGSAVLSTLDPASWAGSSSATSTVKGGVGWHVISKHTPTVSLGK